MGIAENIKMYRKMNKMTQADLAKKLDVGKSTVSSWELGSNKPLMDKITKMAQLWNIRMSELIGEENNSIKEEETRYFSGPYNKPAYKELKGAVAAGSPLEMFEIPEKISVPYEVNDKFPEAYLLEVKGDSMNKILMEGSYVLIDPCAELDNGEVGVVRVNHTEATLKRFYRVGETIILQPESTNYEHQNQIYDCTKGDCDSISVIGKLVWAMTPIGMKF